MKRREEKSIPSLNVDMQFAQINKYVEDTDKIFKEEFKRGVRRVILVFGPLLIGVIGVLIFNSSSFKVSF